MTRLGANGLRVGYGAKEVCGPVDLTLRTGEIVCLLGPNGCGKTTLFKTLLGLLTPLAGVISIDGADAVRLTRRAMARRIAYVPQAHGALFPFRVDELVMMGRAAHLSAFARPGPRDREAAVAALDSLGVGDLAAADYTRVSGGQRQLALIARALAQDAPLMVLDEPTANLDFGNQALVLAQVRRLKDQGVGAILSTHDPDHAFAVADRAVLLHDGRVIADGPPAEALTADRLSAVYRTVVTVEALSDGRMVCTPAA